MITVRLTTDVPDDRRVILTLPPEVPTGRADLVVTVESPNGTTRQPGGVPAAIIRGIASGTGDPPDDSTVEQWIRQRRETKYG